MKLMTSPSPLARVSLASRLLLGSYYVRVREMEECVKIIRQALDRLP
jgi:hypothetical protein